MKTRILLLTLCVFGVSALPLHAQVYGPASLTLANSTITASATTTEANATITVKNNESVGLQLTATGNGAAVAGNVTASFSASLDGSNWSAAYKTVVLALSGNTTVTKVDSVETPGIGYLRLDSINNGGNGTITGTTVKWAVKPKEP